MKNLFFLELFVLVCLLISCSALSAAENEVFHVEKSTIIKEDLILIGKSCLMEGTVKGDAVIINGDLELYGKVEGDAVLLGGTAQLYEGSHVKGDMVAVSGKVIKEEGAIVDGDVVTTNIGPLRYVFKLIPSVTQFSTEQGEVKIEKKDKIKSIRPKIKHPYKGKMGEKMEPLWMLVWGIALSTVIMLFTAIFPSGSETMTLYLEKRPWRSFFTGFLAQILFVPAILFLVLSVLGIPLIPFFMLAYPIALLIGLVPPSLFTGKRITRESTFFDKRSYLLSFMGLFILFVLFFVAQLLQIGSSVLSVMGAAISLLTLFIFYLYFTFGLGSLILSRVGTRKP